MIYLKPNPMPGRYYFSATVNIDDALVEQDVTLDVRMIFMDSKLITYSFDPSSACK